MSSTISDFRSAPNPAPSHHDALQAITYDECVARLAQAVDRHDDSKLDELAMLIGRLAVPIEL